MRRPLPNMIDDQAEPESLPMAKPAQPRARRGLQRERRSSNDSLFRSLRPLAIAWVAAAILWSVVLGQRAVPVNDLLLDSATAGLSPWYKGLVSSVGILLWAVSVCACAATAFVAYHGDRLGATRVFRGAALFFAFLLLDDLFLLHSNVIPKLVPISQHLIMGLEGGLGLLWLIPAWPGVRRTRWEILAAATLALGVSMAVDIFLDGPNAGILQLVAEDGSKFLGGVALATWATVTAADVIRSVTRRASR